MTTRESILNTLEAAKTQAPETLKDSAISLKGRVLWGFSDNWGKLQILRMEGYSGREGSNPGDAVKLPNGEYGVRTKNGAIKPIDPKGFQVTDLLGDISEMGGKTITSGGGILAGMATINPITGLSSPLAIGAGTAGGELVRQGIGETLGVRKPGAQLGDIGEIAGEGAVAGLTAGATNMLLSKFFPKKMLPVGDGNSIDDLLKTKSTKNILAELTPEMKKNLENTSNEQIRAMRFGVDPDDALKAAKLEMTTGIDDDVYLQVIKAAKEGRMISKDPLVLAKSEQNFSNLVNKSLASIEKTRKYANSIYKEALDALPEDKVVNIVEIKETAKNLVLEHPELKSLINRLGVMRPDVGNVLPVKQFMADKATIAESNIMQTYFKNNANRMAISPSENAISGLDSLFRKVINSDEGLGMAGVNEIYGEVIDAPNQIKNLFSSIRGVNMLEKLKDPNAGVFRRLIQPLQEYEASTIKYGGKLGDPLYDDIMDAVVQKSLGSLHGKFTSTLMESSAGKTLNKIPGVTDMITWRSRPINIWKWLESTNNPATRAAKNILINKLRTTTSVLAPQSINSLVYRNIKK